MKLDGYDLVWTVDALDEATWCTIGYFTTETKAKAFVEQTKIVNADLIDESSQFRINWHFLDRGYD